MAPSFPQVFLCVRRLCAALTDLHEPLQLCHVLKCFPSFPSPPIAPCTPDLLGHDLLLLRCTQQLPGLFLFLL